MELFPLDLRSASIDFHSSSLVHQRIRVNSDFLNFHCFQRSTLFVDGYRFHFVQCGILALDHSPKHGVLSIEVRRRLVADEELGAIRSRTFVSHAYNAPPIVPQSWADLVLEILAVDGCAALAFPRRIITAALHHEFCDVAMEGTSVVATAGAESEEVVSRLGHCGAEDFDLQIALGGMKLDGGRGSQPMDQRQGNATRTVTDIVSRLPASGVWRTLRCLSCCIKANPLARAQPGAG